MGFLKQAFDWVSENGHTALDVAGTFPAIGNFADAANALWYAAEGEFDKAGTSAIAMLPGLGQGVTATKLAKAGKVPFKLSNKPTKAVQETADQLKKARQTSASQYKGAKESVEQAQKKLKTDEKIIASPWMKESKDRVVKKSQEDVAAKGSILKKTREQGRASVKTAQGKAKKAQELSDARVNPLGIGGKGFKGKVANVGLGGLSMVNPTNKELEEAEQQLKDKGENKPEDKDKEKDKVNSLLGDGKGEGKGEGDAPTGETDQQPEPTEQTPTPPVEDKEAAAKKREDDTLNQKYDIAAQMDDLMTQDPDYFRKNRGAAQQLFGKARKLGVTAEQFNNYVRNNRAAAQERRRDIDRAEAKQFLQEKLDQPLYESSRGMPTYAQRGRNLAEFFKSSGLKNATPAQVSSLMNPNRGSVLQQVKQDKDKDKPKK